MKTRSCKAKAVTGQNEIRDMYLRTLSELSLDDLRTSLMGEIGADIKKISKKSRALLPWHDEVKRCELISLKAWIAQAVKGHDLPPVIHWRQNKPKGNKEKGYGAKGTWYTLLPTALFMKLLQKKTNENE